jgi:hypothetical protein
MFLIIFRLFLLLFVFLFVSLVTVRIHSVEHLAGRIDTRLLKLYISSSSAGINPQTVKMWTVFSSETTARPGHTRGV